MVSPFGLNRTLVRPHLQQVGDKAVAGMNRKGQMIMFIRARNHFMATLQWRIG